MRIFLIAVGERMPAWVQAGFDDYARRLPREMPLRLVELAPGYRVSNADPARAVADEGERMLRALPKGAHVIALDERGHEYDTRQWAGRLAALSAEGRDLALLVGGPDGLAAACRQRADETWSLSRLTLPHPLVRIVVAEQLYRAQSLLQNHPYHRG